MTPHRHAFLYGFLETVAVLTLVVLLGMAVAWGLEPRPPGIRYGPGDPVLGIDPYDGEPDPYMERIWRLYMEMERRCPEGHGPYPESRVEV